MHRSGRKIRLRDAFFTPQVWALKRSCMKEARTIPTVKCGGGSIMLRECFFLAETRRLVKVDGKNRRS